MLFFAGLHSTLPDGTKTCTLLTREPSEQIAHIHNRMTVLMTQDELNGWIRGEITTTVAKNSLGMGWEGRFKYHEVNNIGRDDDGPELIEPIEKLV